MVAHNGNFDKTAMARLFEDFGVDNPFENIDLLDTLELSKVITLIVPSLDNSSNISLDNVSLFRSA